MERRGRREVDLKTYFYLFLYSEKKILIERKERIGEKRKEESGVADENYSEESQQKKRVGVEGESREGRERGGREGEGNDLRKCGNLL